jgi:hypothetical protein
MQKIINGIACITFLLTIGVISTGYFGYKYITSPEFERTLKNKIMLDLKQKIIKEIPKQLPKFSGQSIPL